MQLATVENLDATRVCMLHGATGVLLLWFQFIAEFNG